MRNYVISKENILIEASYKLTVGENKIVLYYVSKINPKQDKDCVEVKMKILDFVRLLGIEQNKDIYKRIKKASENLLKKVIVIHEEDGDLFVNWFSSVKYHDGEGMVSLKSDSNLTPYLLNLKQYTSYELGNIVKLNSTYSIRIYECLKQYEKIGKRILELKRIKEIMGLDADQYLRFYDFRTKVILKAQSELKEKTDIFFEFEEIRTGRKVTSLKFYINANKAKKKIKKGFKDDIVVARNNNLDPTKNNVCSDLIKHLMHYGIAFNVARSIITNYSEEQIKRNINYTSKENARQNINNPAGFLIKAIKEDFAKDLKLIKKKMDFDHYYNMDFLEKALFKKRKTN